MINYIMPQPPNSSSGSRPPHNPASADAEQPKASAPSHPQKTYCSKAPSPKKKTFRPSDWQGGKPPEKQITGRKATKTTGQLSRSEFVSAVNADAIKYGDERFQQDRKALLANSVTMKQVNEFFSDKPFAQDWSSEQKLDYLIDNITKCLERSEVTVNFPANRLESIVENGLRNYYYPTLKNTKHSGYINSRKKAEEKMLQLPGSVTARGHDFINRHTDRHHFPTSHNRPMYGALNYSASGNGAAGGYRGYGDCFIVLDEKMKPNMTFSAGDSFFTKDRIFSSFEIPCLSVACLNHKTLCHSLFRVLEGMPTTELPSGLSYIEAQIHSPVNFMDSMVKELHTQLTPESTEILQKLEPMARAGSLPFTLYIDGNKIEPSA